MAPEQWKEEIGERTKAPEIEKREEQSLARTGALPAEKTDPADQTAGEPVHYRDLVKRYKKRQRDTLVDTLTTGLSYADEVAVDLGLMEDTGLLGEVTDMVTTALPFVVIAVTEQAKVIMGKKKQKAALQNTVYRMAKTGAAMGAGALAGAVGGLPAAIPAALGVRALLDQHKSKALLGNRVAGRVRRLNALTSRMREKERLRELTDTEGPEDAGGKDPGS